MPKFPFGPFVSRSGEFLGAPTAQFFRGLRRSRQGPKDAGDNLPDWLDISPEYAAPTDHLRRSSKGRSTPDKPDVSPSSDKKTGGDQG